ncbi:hypothetical protein EFZ10_06075 [Tatumella sp. TA1]|nr:hypothetical protein EFZ10_06075 [Tatumella sp. TA1]
MDQKNWKVEKQSEEYIKAVKRTITELPGGYSEAADWLGVTEHSIFNRLRANGDQIFPIAWAKVLQKAGGTTYVIDALAKSCGGTFVPFPENDHLGATDIHQKLLEVYEDVSSYSRLVTEAIEDGEVDQLELEQLEMGLYKSTVTLQQHLCLVIKTFCNPEKVNAPSCSSGRPVATKSLCGESIA